MQEIRRNWNAYRTMLFLIRLIPFNSKLILPFRLQGVHILLEVSWCFTTNLSSVVAFERENAVRGVFPPFYPVAFFPP